MRHDHLKREMKGTQTHARGHRPPTQRAGRRETRPAVRGAGGRDKQGQLRKSTAGLALVWLQGPLGVGLGLSQTREYLHGGSPAWANPPTLFGKEKR